MSFQFTLENQGDFAIEVMAISPRLSERASLVETKDFSTHTPKAQRTKLCHELSLIANHVLLATDRPVVGKGYTLGRYFSLWAVLRARRDPQRTAKEKARFLNIEDSREAENARDQILKKLPTFDASLEAVYAFKLAKLQALEPREQETDQTAAKNREAAPLALIESWSLFRGTYIVHFRRRWFNTALHAFAVEVLYREKDRQHNEVVTATLPITPKPLVLSGIAAVASYGGIVLKHCVEIMGKAVDCPNQKFVFPAIRESAEAISALILAFIFINVFESTELGKESWKNLNWRIAMLIGVLCGLGADKIVKSIGALIGS